MNVIVYTTPTCPYCSMVKKYLSQKSVPFVEKDVSRDQAAALEMVNRSGQQGVPVVTIGNDVVVGFNKPLLEQLLSQKPAAAHPSLGVSVADAPEHAAVESGAYIGRVRPGSPAEQAGLRKGDVILELAGQQINSALALVNLSQKLPPGQAVPVIFLRDGQRLVARLRI